MRRFLKNENASLTLEAAMIMPIFLLFIVFLTSLIRIGIADIALDHAASETTAVIATHVYPAALVAKEVKTTIDTYVQEKSGHVLDLNQAVELSNTALKQFGMSFSSKESIGQLSAKVLTPYVRKKFSESAGNQFDKNNLKIINISFPGGLQGGAVDLTVQYNLKLFIPFIHKTLALRKRSYEKLWTGT